MQRWFAVVLFALLAGSGWATAAAPAAGATSVKGTVQEVKDVDAYTYLRLKTADGETWAAVTKAPVKVGTQVTIENAMVMTNFESKTLKKTFDKIVFGTLAGPAGGAKSAANTAAPAPGGTMGAMHAGMGKPGDVADVKVPKATGPDAKTVAEVVAKGPELKNKNVVVSGKVVKYTPGVMGKNWVHIRDGSGSADAGTNDILVTTMAETRLGDVVVFKGVVHTDVDLGAGYAYKVLIEEATLQK